MNFSYRTHYNALAVAARWNRPLEARECYKVEALTDEAAEILIYDLIGWPFNDASTLVRELSGMTQREITVRINSPGGDVFDAVAIFNALQSHKAKIITRIEALAASAASFIALAGKEVHAYKNAFFMIHNPWTMAAGDDDDLHEIANLVGKIKTNMIDMYADNSNVGKKEIKDMMKAETWLTAKQAQEKGFIDSIVDGRSVKAAFDLSMFAHAPDGLIVDREHELTERDAEKALRDAGFSRNRAKALLAGGKATDGEAELIAAAQKTLKIFGGHANG